MPSTKDKRIRELAAIHAAKRDLGLSDDDYRALLSEVVNVTSAKDLDDAGRRRVINHLRQLGWKQRPRRCVANYPGTPHNLAIEPMLQKIEALLANMSLSWGYADAIAKRQSGVERVAWLREPGTLKAVIAALHVEKEKRTLLAAVDEQLVKEGINRDQLAQRFDLKSNWHRDRRALKRVLELLNHAEGL